MPFRCKMSIYFPKEHRYTGHTPCVHHRTVDKNRAVFPKRIGTLLQKTEASFDVSVVTRLGLEPKTPTLKV